MSIVAEQFDAEVQRVELAMQSLDMTEAWVKARAAVLQNVRDNFTSSVGPQGETWPPRKIVGDGHPLLIDTGRLLQAAVGNTGESAKEITRDSLTVGVRGVPYAAIHQFGGDRIPARPYFGAGKETLESVAELLADEGLEQVWN